MQATAIRLLRRLGGLGQSLGDYGLHLADGIRKQLPQLPESNLLIESEGRGDTAPAVAWATMEVAKRHGDDAVVGFFPADHWIGNLDQFHQTLHAAAELAVSHQAIATLGIAPTYPFTGYGYIEQGDDIGTFKDLPGYAVARFTEKPDQATAEGFLSSGRFSWNSGMFIFQAGLALKELAQYAPEVLDPLRASGPSCYPTPLPKISIDYALMEKTERACVLPVTFEWDDLGDWNAIERLHRAEGAANVELCQHVGGTRREP